MIQSPYTGGGGGSKVEGKKKKKFFRKRSASCVPQDLKSKVYGIFDMFIFDPSPAKLPSTFETRNLIMKCPNLLKIAYFGCRILM